MDYPTTLPCPLISSGNSVAAKSSVAVNFDYRSRITRIPKRRSAYTIESIFNETELDAFMVFYDSIIKTKTFNATWVLDANINSNKIVKMIDSPSVKSLGNLSYNITFTIEVLWFGTIYSNPLYPYTTLYPSKYLFPSGV